MNDEENFHKLMLKGDFQAIIPGRALHRKYQIVCLNSCTLFWCQLCVFWVRSFKSFWCCSWHVVLNLSIYYSISNLLQLIRFVFIYPGYVEIPSVFPSLVYKVSRGWLLLAKSHFLFIFSDLRERNVQFLSSNCAK